MTGYLLDTNACIDFLVGRSDPLARRMGQAFGRLHVSAITAGELRVGNRRSTDPVRDAKRVATFLAAIGILSFDAEAAVAYAEMAQAIGMRRGIVDRLIAAQALSTRMTLVTNNEPDFTGIPGLAIENWTL
ncbi:MULTISPECIES: type II toxin-antitoxin system VapC family toxin [Sphingomonas]|jgi:tRNA(fMet)-specific endonuclease VapC|uniref:type II toxin-antitoxin system VapC family toxin n=1 Tax=Sphingomonas TaxID=13687 RepID=UPI00083080AC|nr:MULTISPECIES: type II toxin-antitoxin system VapC family toxin [Sphingomonas]MBY0302201.1 type II toxin-antitoxin system VapC family toxin [Sphingomonas ginsenosidimutans]